MVGYKDTLYVFGGEVGFSNGIETPMWMYHIKQQFSPTKPRCFQKTFQKKRCNSPKKTVRLFCTIVTQCLYSDGSLQMGQMGPKMTLGTLKMNGNDFPGVQGVLRGSNSVHDLISYIYWRQSDTVYCSRKGGRQRGKGWSKSFFLENKVVINFNFRHGAKKSGQSGHSFRSYGFFQ